MNDHDTGRRWLFSDPQMVADLIAECPGELAAYRPSMRYFLLEERAQDPDELAGMSNLAAVVFRLEKCETPEEVRQALPRGRWSCAWFFWQMTRGNHRRRTWISPVKPGSDIR